MELLEKIGQGFLLIAIITALLYCVIATALDVLYQRCDPAGESGEESAMRREDGEDYE